MKLKSNLGLIILLSFIILYCCLGDMLREGFHHLDADHPTNQQNIETPVNDYIKGKNKNQVSPDYTSKYYSGDLTKDNDDTSTKNSSGFTNFSGGVTNTSNNSRQAPNNNNDLYILKSQIVPPVCPVCPTVSSSTDKCQPCPPCARCPEPSFECKKVPNYQSNNVSYLPRPLLNNFSTF